MKARWRVLVAAGTLAVTAFAEEFQFDLPDNTPAMRQNPPGEAVPSVETPPAKPHQVSGEVLYTDGDTLWLADEGRVIPLTLRPETDIEDTELLPGDEVRATYVIEEGARKVATQVEPVEPPPQPLEESQRLPVLVPDEGESKGPASPLPPLPVGEGKGEGH
ncbi:MAG: hypothetical protein ACOZIN_19710 [Myxococcota bacterium]